MHRLVFENGVHRLTAIEERMTRLLDRRRAQRIEHPAIRFLHERENLVTPRPLRSARRRRHVLGIDPSCEHALEAGIDARPAERPLDQGIEAERREMPFIEDDGMPQRNRLRVVGFRGEQVEQPA